MTVSPVINATATTTTPAIIPAVLSDSGQVEAALSGHVEATLSGHVEATHSASQTSDAAVEKN